MAILVLMAAAALLLLLAMRAPTRSSAPRRCRRSRSDPAAGSTARRKPEWVVQEVIYLASHLRSCRKVKEAFNRAHGSAARIGHTFAWEVMRDHALAIEQMRRARKRRSPAPMPLRRHWALDITFLHRQWPVLGILDAGSRQALLLRHLSSKCAFTLLGHLLITIGRFGIPESIRTDCEAMFFSRMWRTTLQALQVSHRHGPPRQPWRNGRIERFFGTLKSALRERVVDSGAATQGDLERFRLFYNHLRPHSALGGLTPGEAWNQLDLSDMQRAYARHGAVWVSFGREKALALRC
ncbi:integrase core domain-containing protein [Ramlibacter humi]|uniref:Transposase n=1 Tax=Ramlibacter humi TaxID=2530451 RepID=A0A4Z0BFI0_9BURK|nr:integrase core domain-containing protein [Ramlibacter humi]TFY97067.1 transposase [Ramlibacter humi]